MVKELVPRLRRNIVSVQLHSNELLTIKFGRDGKNEFNLYGNGRMLAICPDRADFELIHTVVLSILVPLYPYQEDSRFEY